MLSLPHDRPDCGAGTFLLRALGLLGAHPSSLSDKLAPFQERLSHYSAPRRLGTELFVPPRLSPRLRVSAVKKTVSSLNGLDAPSHLLRGELLVALSYYSAP